MRKKREKKIDPRITQTSYNSTVPPGRGRSIICDLDGTLSMMNDRFPYDGKGAIKDVVNEAVLNVIETYAAKGYKLFLFSGRNSDKGGLEATKAWLQKYLGPIPYVLEMRKPGDTRKDTIVKQEMFDYHVRDKYKVLFVLDDRNMMVDHWRSMGLDCFQVYYGDF